LEIVVDVAAADAKTLVATVAVAVAVVVAAAVAVAVAVAVVVAAAAAAAVVVGVRFGAAAVPAGITVVSSVPLNSGAVDQMKPIAAARKPVTASVEDGVKVRQDQT
jgi:hypothetical protein